MRQTRHTTHEEGDGNYRSRMNQLLIETLLQLKLQNCQSLDVISCLSRAVHILILYPSSSEEKKLICDLD